MTTTSSVANKPTEKAVRRKGRPRPRRPVEIKNARQYQAICQRCRDALLAIQAGVIVGHYQLGKLVLEAESMTTAQRHAYSLADRLATDIGVSSRLLRLCAQFASNVDEKVVPRINDAGMSWDHLRVLMNQGQLDLLTKWMRHVKEKQLSASQLDEELRGGRLPERSGSGRKAARPSSALAGLTQLHKQVTSTSNRFGALFSDQFDLASSLRDTPPDDLSEEILDSVVHAANQLKQMAEAAQAHATDLENVTTWIAGVFEFRRKAAEERVPPNRTGIPANQFSK
jgi:hypothetical protein